MTKIRIAVVGLGKLGAACVEQIKERADEFELVAVFSRRAVAGTIPLTEIEKFVGEIDVVLICVGSRGDAPEITPRIAASFSTVDSFDMHAGIREYAESISAKGKLVSIVSAGWEPGLLSVVRMYFGAIFANEKTQTFWGPGVSMGHTNALRRIDGVTDAIQFTVPDERRGKHRRDCFLVADKEDRAGITEAIVNMPEYFAGQDVRVRFVSRKSFKKRFHSRNEHAGAVLAADDYSAAEFRVRLLDNARFTAGVMLAYAVANYNLQKAGKSGVFSVADIAPKYLLQQGVWDLI